MTKIYLFPKMAPSMPEEEFQPFIAELMEDHPDLESEYVWYETRGYGVTFWEVLTIYVACKVGDAVIEATVGELVKGIIEKGKRWVQRHRDTHDWHHRPFALTVRDADGNLLAAIDIDRDGNATDAATQRPPREMPPFDLVPDDIQ